MGGDGFLSGRDEDDEACERFVLSPELAGAVSAIGLKEKDVVITVDNDVTIDGISDRESQKAARAELNKRWAETPGDSDMEKARTLAGRLGLAPQYVYNLARAEGRRVPPTLGKALGIPTLDGRAVDAARTRKGAPAPRKKAEKPQAKPGQSRQEQLAGSPAWMRDEDELLAKHDLNRQVVVNKLVAQIGQYGAAAVADRCFASIEYLQAVKYGRSPITLKMLEGLGVITSEAAGRVERQHEPPVDQDSGQQAEAPSAPENATVSHEGGNEEVLYDPSVWTEGDVADPPSTIEDLRTQAVRATVLDKVENDPRSVESIAYDEGYQRGHDVGLHEWQRRAAMKLRDELHGIDAEEAEHRAYIERLGERRRGLLLAWNALFPPAPVGQQEGAGAAERAA